MSKLSQSLTTPSGLNSDNNDFPLKHFALSRHVNKECTNAGQKSFSSKRSHEFYWSDFHSPIPVSGLFCLNCEKHTLWRSIFSTNTYYTSLSLWNTVPNSMLQLCNIQAKCCLANMPVGVRVSVTLNSDLI